MTGNLITFIIFGLVGWIVLGSIIALLFGRWARTQKGEPR